MALQFHRDGNMEANSEGYFFTISFFESFFPVPDFGGGHGRRTMRHVHEIPDAMGRALLVLIANQIRAY